MLSPVLPDVDHELVVEASVVEVVAQGTDEHCQALCTINHQIFLALQTV